MVRPSRSAWRGCLWTAFEIVASIQLPPDSQPVALLSPSSSHVDNSSVLILGTEHVARVYGIQAANASASDANAATTALAALNITASQRDGRDGTALDTTKLQDEGDGFDYGVFSLSPPPPANEHVLEENRSQDNVVIIVVLVGLPVFFWICVCCVVRTALNSYGKNEGKEGY